MTTQVSGDVLTYVDRDGNIHEAVGVVDLGTADVRRLATVFGPMETVEFADGEVLLAPVELTDAARADNGLGRILSVALMLKVANAAHVDAVFFDAAPVGSYTPGDAFALDVDDVDKIISVFHIDQWAALGVAISWGSATLSPTAFHCSDSGRKRSIWVALAALGNITLATTSDAKLLVQAARE